MEVERAKQAEEIKVLSTKVTAQAAGSKVERRTLAWWKIGVAFVVGAVVMWMCMVAAAYYADTHGANGRMIYGSIRNRRW